jgi:hypothetical protein
VFLLGPDEHLTGRHGEEETRCHSSRVSSRTGGREGGRTGPVEGKGGEGRPGDGFEEVVGAGDDIESVASGDRTRLGTRGSEGTQVEMRDGVTHRGELCGQ